MQDDEARGEDVPRGDLDFGRRAAGDNAVALDDDRGAVDRRPRGEARGP